MTVLSRGERSSERAFAPPFSHPFAVEVITDGNSLAVVICQEPSGLRQHFLGAAQSPSNCKSNRLLAHLTSPTSTEEAMLVRYSGACPVCQNLNRKSLRAIGPFLNVVTVGCGGSTVAISTSVLLGRRVLACQSTILSVTEPRVVC